MSAAHPRSTLYAADQRSVFCNKGSAALSVLLIRLWGGDGERGMLTLRCRGYFGIGGGGDEVLIFRGRGSATRTFKES